METEGKRILVNYLTDIADTFRSITGETDTISAKSFAKEVQTVATSSSKNSLSLKFQHWTRVRVNFLQRCLQSVHL